jgi:hypothetical protein
MQAAYKGKDPKPKGFARPLLPPGGWQSQGPLGRPQGRRPQPGDLPPEGASRPGVAPPRPQAKPQAGSKQGPKQALVARRHPEGSQKAPRNFPECSQRAPTRRFPEGPQRVSTKLPGGSLRAPRRIPEGSQKGLSLQVSRLPRPHSFPGSQKAAAAISQVACSKSCQKPSESRPRWSRARPCLRGPPRAAHLLATERGAAVAPP